MKTKKESIVLSIILFCLVLIAVGMSYAFLKTSFFANKTSVLKVGSLSLILDETSGNAITVEDGTPMYDSEGMKQDNYFTFSLKNNGTLASSYTIYLENQSLDEGDTRVNSNYVRYNLEKDNSVLQPTFLDGDQAIDKGIIKKNQTINYKMRLWFANDIPQSEENKVFKAKLNVVGNQNTKMMAQELGLTNDEKSTITNIVFQDSIKSIKNESKVWDTSAAKNKTVMARLVPNTDDTATNTLYIQSDGEVFANYYCNIFQMFDSLKTIKNIKLLNTSNVTSMAFMFSGCKSLESIDITNFNTSTVKNMRWMFANCQKLTTINLKEIDTSQVTDMSYMFQNCSSLANLDVSSFDTSQVKNTAQMFAGCKQLTEINLNNFDTSQVTSMYNMFSDCSSLTNLDLSGFNTSNTTSTTYMFSNCNNLTSLNVRSFDTSKVTNMGSMFSGCSNLTTIDVSNFNTSKVTDMSSMFHSCKNLQELNLSNFDTSSVTNMGSMFLRCNNLIMINLSSFDTSNVTNMNSMFHSCKNLQQLNLSNFDTSSVTNMSYMFQECHGLKQLDFRDAIFDNVINYRDVFAGISTNIKVITKNESTKAWLEDKLSSSEATITIA